MTLKKRELNSRLTNEASSNQKPANSRSAACGNLLVPLAELLANTTKVHEVKGGGFPT